jgi:glycosyltransferase involved in cell wall biosynthesis
MHRVERSVLVVIPALNEEDSVADVVRDVRRGIPSARCLVVDGVLSLPYNLGVGGAMRTGFRFARDNGHEVVVQVDADGQHDAAMVNQLLSELDGADLVIGARFAGAGHYEVRGPRKWAMKLLATVMSRVARTPLTDITSGFKAAGPRAVALFAEEFPAEYLGDTIEALVIGSRAGLAIRQIPVVMRARQGGTPSHHPIKAAMYLTRACAAFALAMLRPRTQLEEKR